MSQISQIAKQVLTTGYLDISTEQSLRELRSQSLDRNDLKIFIHFLWEFSKGKIRQESREEYERSRIALSS
mgnify:CR=1 FL=1